VQLLVDGTAADERFDAGITLENALRQVQANLPKPGRLVVAIRCDGRDISGDELTDLLRLPLMKYSRLEVFTSSVGELVIGAMHQAAQSLQESESSCRRVGELLAEGKTTEGVRLLGECLRFWQQIHEAVGKSIQLMRLDVDAMTINDEPFINVFGKPKEVLTQVKQALEAQDHVLLADVLQYEFTDVTDLWYAVIARIRQTAEDRGDAAAPAS